MMRPLHDCRLYGIIDLGYVERGDAARIVEQMIEGGVDLIQLRGKTKSIGELVELSAELHELAAKSSTPLIVNDHAEIARRVPVEGVHVGQDDDPIKIVRQKAARACSRLCVDFPTRIWRPALRRATSIESSSCPTCTPSTGTRPTISAYRSCCTTCRP